jgi:hypothetical protein
MGVSEIWPLNILFCRWGLLLLATVATQSLIICQTAPSSAALDVCILSWPIIPAHQDSVFG